MLSDISVSKKKGVVTSESGVPIKTANNLVEVTVRDILVEKKDDGQVMVKCMTCSNFIKKNFNAR